jgi:Lysozyme like domain
VTASCTGAGGQKGTLYTYAQLEGLWINAGGPKALAPTMAAIAEAESGGCSAAYNASGATGLWQILGAVNPADQGSLYSPQVNAKEAVLKYKTQGLNAWQTFQTGAYKAYMNGKTTPDLSGIGSGLSGTTSGGSSQTTGGVSGGSAGCLVGWSGVNVPLFGSVGSFCLFTKTEARAFIGTGILAAGSGIMFVGLAVLTVAAFSKTKAGQVAGRAAGSVAEGAGAVAAVAGAPEIGAALSRGGSHVRSHSGGRRSATGRVAPARLASRQRSGREAAAQNRHDERQYDEVMNRKRDSAKGPAIRDEEPVPF